MFAFIVVLISFSQLSSSLDPIQHLHDESSSLNEILHENPQFKHVQNVVIDAGLCEFYTLRDLSGRNSFI